MKNNKEDESALSGVGKRPAKFNAGRKPKFTVGEIEKLFEKYKKYIEGRPLVKYEPVKTGPKTGELIEIKVRRPMTLSGFCVYIGVSQTSFQRWVEGVTEERSPGLTDMVQYIKSVIETDQIEGALAGLYNPTLAINLTSLRDGAVQVASQTINLHVDGKQTKKLS